MSSMNENFPIPRDSEKDEHDIDETEDESVVSRFVYEDLFPRVVIVQMQSPIELSPPPIDTVMGQDDGSHDFIIKRRRLSYLCNILRSWQRGVTSQSVITFPEFTDVRDATDTTTRNIIVFDHHRLSWRSGVEIFVQSNQKTLVVHLPNDGYLYIPDGEMEVVQQAKPNDRHPTEPNGWAVLKTSRRQSAMEDLEGFTIFADQWFGLIPYEKTVLYSVMRRRIDICFQSQSAVVDGANIALEFSFERDWPVTDESDWWF